LEGEGVRGTGEGVGEGGSFRVYSPAPSAAIIGYGE
jgi:hypothetical protein